MVVALLGADLLFRLGLPGPVGRGQRRQPRRHARQIQAAQRGQLGGHLGLAVLVRTQEGEIVGDDVAAFAGLLVDQGLVQHLVGHPGRGDGVLQSVELVVGRDQRRHRHGHHQGEADEVRHEQPRQPGPEWAGASSGSSRAGRRVGRRLEGHGGPSLGVGTGGRNQITGAESVGRASGGSVAGPTLGR